VTSRAGTRGDVDAIGRIYNQEIEDRVTTFETRLCDRADIEPWFDSRHPIVVVEDELR
jgi:L-amino acid N-acyltransferase YncA